MTSRTRLFRELKEFQQRSNASEGIELCPDESNIFHWNAVLKVSEHDDERSKASFSSSSWKRATY